MIDLLLNNLDLILDADGDGKRVRDAILQLAVRGRLVAQEEGPVAQSIRASVSIIGGSTPSKSRADYWDGSIPWVSPKDMKVSVIEDSKDHISSLALEERTQKTVPEGSVLIVIRGMILAHSFPVAVTAREVTINQDMKALVPDKCVVPEWLALALRGSKLEVLSRVERSTHGTCKLALAEVLDLPVSVPPLAEQHRIVAKVDELMEHAAVVEERHLASTSARVRLRDAALHALAEAEDHEAVETAWSKIEEHFDDLFTEPEDIQPLRQTILQLAVRGRLVAQEAGDEEVGDQVEALGPFDTPSSWKWVRLTEVAQCRLGKMLDKAKNKGQLVPYLRNTNIHWFDVRLDSLKEMPLEPDEIHEFEVLPGDVLVCEGGHGIGRAAVWEGGLQYVAFQKALHRIRAADRSTGHFLSYCISVYHEIGFLATYYTGSGIPHLTGKSLATIPFPLPPLAEQHRIVAKVDELMALCDTLETSLKRAKTTREQFASSISHALTGPTAASA